MNADDVIAQLEATAAIHDVTHRGHWVRWRRFGAGEPLVLLHGGHGSWMHWLRNIASLSARHAVWVPDLPGFHDSAEAAVDEAGAQTLPALVEALAITLDALVGPGTPVNLAGFSFGGFVAAHLAVRRPLVHRMALLGAAGHGTPRRQVLPLANWKACVPDALRDAMRQNLAALMIHDVRAIDALAVEIHLRSCTRTRFSSKPISRAGGLQRVLDGIDRPVLMIWGEHDVTAFPEALAPALCGDRAERAWCLVPAAGHWVQYEQAAAVNQRLLGWFEVKGPAAIASASSPGSSP